MVRFPTLIVALALALPGVAYADHKPEHDKAAQTQSGGANSGCGAYCPTDDKGTQGGHQHGSRGKADSKNPPGQAPDGSDNNRGYECDRQTGVGDGNPAHTGCAPGTTTPPQPGKPAKPGKDKAAKPGKDKPAKPGMDKPAKPGKDKPAKPGNPGAPKGPTGPTGVRPLQPSPGAPAFQPTVEPPSLIDRASAPSEQDDDKGGVLAFTGFEVWMLGLLGLALAAAGAWLLHRSRQ